MSPSGNDLNIYRPWRTSLLQYLDPTSMSHSGFLGSFGWYWAVIQRTVGVQVRAENMGLIGGLCLRNPCDPLQPPLACSGGYLRCWGPNTS